MSDAAIESSTAKEAMKRLKVTRKEQIAGATARMKEQRRALKAIRGCLADAELTVPEIAAATAMPVSEVLWYVATLKKYGEILEGAKAGSYFRYRLGQATAVEEADQTE